MTYLFNINEIFKIDNKKLTEKAPVIHFTLL